MLFRILSRLRDRFQSQSPSTRRLILFGVFLSLSSFAVGQLVIYRFGFDTTAFDTVWGPFTVGQLVWLLRGLLLFCWSIFFTFWLLFRPAYEAFQSHRPFPASIVYSYVQSPAFAEAYNAANLLAFFFVTYNVGFFEAFVVDLVAHLAIIGLFVAGETLEERPLHLAASPVASFVVDYGRKVVSAHGKAVPVLVGGAAFGWALHSASNAYVARVGATATVEAVRIDADAKLKLADAQHSHELEKSRMELEKSRMELEKSKADLEKSRLEADRSKRWW